MTKTILHAPTQEQIDMTRKVLYWFAVTLERTEPYAYLTITALHEVLDALPGTMKPQQGDAE